MKKLFLLFFLISTSLFSQTLDLPPDIAKAMLKAHAASIKPGISSFVIKHGNRNLKEISLTFDDGYNYDIRLLDLLKQYNIIPTIFIVGAVVHLHPDFVKQMDDLGWEIANHTYTHPWSTLTDNKILSNEITLTYEEIKKVTGKEPIKYFRPPWGAYNPRVLETVSFDGYKIILWDNEINDWIHGLKVDQQVQHSLELLQNGNILLCHFGGHNTYDVLKILIPEILNKGYRFVTITEMIAHLNEKSDG
jgi:peptidoglycan/xylan/chitin deacetylase (PgdA/CDA1 family)